PPHTDRHPRPPAALSDDDLICSPLPPPLLWPPSLPPSLPVPLLPQGGLFNLSMSPAPCLSLSLMNVLQSASSTAWSYTHPQTLLLLLDLKCTLRKVEGGYSSNIITRTFIAWCTDTHTHTRTHTHTHTSFLSFSLHSISPEGCRVPRWAGGGTNG